MRITHSILTATAALLTAVPASAQAQVWVAQTGGTATVFESHFALAAGDSDRTADLYVRAAGQTRVVTDGKSAGKYLFAGASENGAAVFFQGEDGHLRVRTAAGLAEVTAEPAEVQGVTADGAKAYVQSQSQLTADDGDDKLDVYEYATADGSMRLVTKQTGNWDAAHLGHLPSGVTLFGTREQVVDTDLDEDWDIYAASGDTITKVSPGNGPHSAILHAVSSQTGRIVFSTVEKLVPADLDERDDIYTTDGSALTLATPSPNAGLSGKQTMFVRSRATDAGRILFTTPEPLVATDKDTADDLYAFENGQLSLLTPGPGAFSVREVSDDAATVLISSPAPLLASDTDQSVDMYLVGSGGLVHLLKTNLPFDQTAGDLSPDGSVAAFATAEPVVAADTDQRTDVYTHQAGNLSLASGPETGKAADPANDVKLDGVLADGEVVMHTAERLLPADRNEHLDVYGFLGGKLSLISADEFAPDTAMTVQEGTNAFSSKLWADDQARFECRVDDGAWTACDETWVAGPLAPGQHTLQARAIDVAGNADATPAQHAVTVPGGQLPGNGTGGPTPITPVQEPAVVARDTVAPVLASAKVKRSGRLTYSLSEAGSVRVVVQRRAGRRWKKVRGVVLAGAAGANRAKLPKLPRRGTFRVALVASDAAGNSSAKLTVRVPR